MPRLHPRYARICVLMLLLLSGCGGVAPSAVGATATSVAASIETAPMPHAGDVADDPTIWVNPADPAQSTIIGTDKLGGLAVYDLTVCSSSPRFNARCNAQGDNRTRTNADETLAAA